MLELPPHEILILTILYSFVNLNFLNTTTDNLITAKVENSNIRDIMLLFNNFVIVSSNSNLNILELKLLLSLSVI